MLLRFYFIVFCSAIFFAVPGCSSVSNSSGPSISSFTKAKYLTELTYITRNKGLVRRYREAYIAGSTNRPEFRELNKWSKGRDRESILETVKLFLDLEFAGQ